MRAFVLFLAVVCSFCVLSCLESEVETETLTEVANYETDDSVYLYPVWKDDYWGYMDSLGNMIISPRFDDAYDFQERLGLVHYKGAYAMVDPKGTLVIPNQFEDLGQLREGLAYASKGESYGYINRDGNWVIEPQFDFADDFENGAAGVTVNDLDGLIDTSANWLIPAEYATIYRYEDNLNYAEVTNVNEKTGVRKLGGDMVVPAEFRYIDWYQGFFYAEDLAGAVAVYDTAGQRILQGAYQEVEFDTVNHVFLASNKDETTLFSEQGKLLYGPVEFIDPFSEGLARVENNGATGYINASGDEVVAMIFVDGASAYSENRVVVWDQVGTNAILLDEKGNVVSTEKYAHIGGFSNGRAVANVDASFGYIDADANLVIPATYQVAERFREGLAVVNDGNGFGLIDTEGNVVAPMKYEYLSGFHDGYCDFEIDGLSGVMDATGKELFSVPKGELYTTTAGYWEVWVDQKVGLLDPSGRMVLPAEYDAITFHGRLLVVQDDKFYGVFDRNGQPLIPVKCTEVDLPEKGVLSFWLEYPDGKPGYVTLGGKVIWDPGANTPL